MGKHSERPRFASGGCLDAVSKANKGLATVEEVEEDLVDEDIGVFADEPEDPEVEEEDEIADEDRWYVTVLTVTPLDGLDVGADADDVETTPGRR